MRKPEPDQLKERGYRLCREALEKEEITHDDIVEIEETFNAAVEHEDSTIAHTLACHGQANRLNQQRDDYGRYSYPPRKTRREEIIGILTDTVDITVR